MLEVWPFTVWLVALAIGFAGGFGGVFLAVIVLPAVVAAARWLAEQAAAFWYGLTAEWR